MPMRAKYVHTNLITKDWKKLSEFYIQVLGCTPVYPERDMKGDWLDQGTGIENVHIQGIHLRLPGYGNNGPTLEIFQYNRQMKGHSSPVNRPGFSHIAFEVDDVHKMSETVINNGGKKLGKIINVKIPDVGKIIWTYMRDPEGNIIELQHWE